MEPLFWILGSTLLVSAISFVGVLTLALGQKMLKQVLILLVAFSAGGLMGGAAFHLIPEAIAGYTLEGIDTLFIYVIVGFVMFFLLEKILHWRHRHDTGLEKDAHSTHSFGYMNFVGDAVHNFIDGLVIAASFITDFSLGMAATIAIVFHEIPQEIGDFGVLLHSGFSERKAIALNFVTALAAAVGGIVGFFISSYASAFVQTLLPMAAGGFIYIAASDLIPEIKNVTDTKKSVLSFFVFLLGILLMWATKAALG